MIFRESGIRNIYFFAFLSLVLNNLFENAIVEQKYFSESVSIVIPAYNEEKRIKPVLEEACEFITNYTLNWKVYVSIDGNDQTDKVVSEFSSKYNFVKFSKSNSRGGKGFAIKRTLSWVNTDITILMDADGAVKLAEIVPELNRMQDYDFINFNRYVKGNDIPLLRRFVSRGYNLFLKTLFRIREKDTQSGYKILKTDLLKRIFDKITIQDGFFYVGMFFYARKEKAKSIEVPIRYNHVEGSKFEILSMVLGGLASGIALRVRYTDLYKHIPKKVIDLYYKKFKWI
ncbi:MAG: glycosyltransferase [Thermoplasmatales archaeon]